MQKDSTAEGKLSPKALKTRMKAFLINRKSRSALQSRTSTPVPSPRLPRSMPATRTSTAKQKKKFTPILPPSSPDREVNQLEFGQLPPGQSRYGSFHSSGTSYSTRRSISMDMSGLTSLNRSSRSPNRTSMSDPGQLNTPQCDMYGYVRTQNTKYSFSSLGSSGGEGETFEGS